MMTANSSHYYFQGEDWDELERKAAKCKSNFNLQVSTNWTNSTADKKRVEGGQGKGDDSDDSDRPKKKAPAKSKSKSQGKPPANGKGRR